MTTINGTSRNDDISTEGRVISGSLVIRGAWGDDRLYSDYRGHTKLYGDAGNDQVTAERGYAFGGDGNDFVNSGIGEAWGGVGNDYVSVASGLAVGGKGNDSVRAGHGAHVRLYGDEGPGKVQAVAGNDNLYADLYDNHVLMNGGKGKDVFHINAQPWDEAGTAEIMDFVKGKDKLSFTVIGDGGDGDLFSLFKSFDRNNDSVLNARDRGDGYYSVSVDTAAREIVLTGEGHAVIVHGVTSLTVADWLFT